MTMAVNNQQNEPPHEDLMRITFKGLSWAENICQTVEKICTESNIVKNSYKYVDAVGEQLKNILDAVANDLDNPDDDDDVLLSDVSFGSDALLKSSEKEGTKFDGIESDGKLLPCGNWELATCVEDLSPKEEDDYTGKCKTTQDGGSNFSVSRERSHGDFLHGTVFDADWTDFVPFSSQSLSSISHQTISTGEQSLCKSVCVDSNPQETLCILESEESAYALKKGHERTGICEISPKCASQENLNSYSREEDHRIHSVFFMENDDMNEFEDETLDNDFEEVKLGNCWDDISKYKIGENSSQTSKRISYKKKLKRMLLSRFWTSRESELAKYHEDLHSLPSLDSDWQLIERGL